MKSSDRAEAALLAVYEPELIKAAAPPRTRAIATPCPSRLMLEIAAVALGR